ncbi:MAG: serine hydrolase [Bdellovibrionales bacterium]
MPFIYTLSSCTSKNTSTEAQCSLSTIEEDLNNSLTQATTDTDFSFYLEREDGKTYAYNRGGSTLNTTYESASTSKWVSAAIILWALDQTPGLTLTDIPSNHFTWSMPPTDPLYNTTLSQLLSFTSGLQEEAACLTLGFPLKTYNECINDLSGSIVSLNTGNGYSPNTSFYYSNSHLQVAGAMAVSSGSHTSWQDLFNAFQVSTGLFPNSSYNLPSITNARLAGGMSWTGSDYISFLKSLLHNTLLSTSTQNEMFKDHVENLPIAYSPAFTGLGEQWHYGYGTWLECNNSTFNCSSIDYYSSPGAYGAYPFINFDKKFFGLIARQGALGTYVNGIALFRSVKSKAEEWASCTNT